MDDEIDQAAKLAREKHPKRNATPIQYGTAGFRAKSSMLDYVLYRMGLLAVLRSKYKTGSTIGLIVTASHNPEEDNGVKLIDPMGEMLERSWEHYATQLVNASDDDLNSVLRGIIDQASIKTEVAVKVVIARDTRPSSVPLSLAAQDGVQVLGGQAIDYGLLITPQLHYIVRCMNTRGAYGDPTEAGYYTKIASAFLKLRGGDGSHGNYHPVVQVDGANGVGAPKLQSIIPYLNGMLGIKISNDGSSGKLNHNCGADFVKVQQKAPEGMRVEPNQRCVSFDGDGDRIVFFYQDQSGKFFLVDGDKIATLLAGYLKEVVAQSGLELKFGLVQTAYANGSSTDYINNKLNVHVVCVPTGVKYLHHEAMNFDIGVYFEANGHGTVSYFSSAYIHPIMEISNALCQ
ncbi:hypothetical protein NP493_79g06004 [Ridgeia piscesae]|uniref:phosphoacetylglucosamine mutase n=1 Tax=Ridgeia piscesae TaxID=27915 RepID=A0AAD9P8Y0_RIDPI|nr:hypothetical protein NP493_79g06004 [Ridgeia piscesae]